MKDNKLGIMPISKLIWNMSLPMRPPSASASRIRLPEPYCFPTL